MLGYGFYGLVVVTQIADVCQMLNKTPLRNIDCSRVLQGIVQISDTGRFLPDLDGLVVANLRQMPFENDSGDGTSSPRELVLRKLLRCI